MVKLSVLICTMPHRKQQFDLLVAELQRQIKGRKAEIIFNDNDGTVGSKRQQLLEYAKGEYIVYVDDDDTVSENYISSIFDNMGADCIGMKGIMTTNGANSKEWVISMYHDTWHEKDNIFYRHTNHLSPVKRNIAIKVGFNNKSFGEDYDYSMGLRGLLKSENMIPFPVYHYQYKTGKK